MTLPRINSFTNWGRLEEVWLGDCYPAHFYDQLESEVRDVFYAITENTQEDLAVIQRKLEEFGVQVRRPCYDRIEDFLMPQYHPTSAGQLCKPMICPRDHFLVFGNTLFGGTWDHRAWTDAIAEYALDSGSHIVERPNIPGAGHINGANTVRAGRDFYLDSYWNGGDIDVEYLQQTFKDYRLHVLNNGGHVDGCFAIAKPGVLITSKYYDDYERTFPGWEKINISQPEFSKHTLAWRTGPGHNGKWHVPGVSDSAKFNDHVIKHAQDWVGDYTETYFEVNCLVIDEKNVLMLGENEGVFRELERHGITAHSLPFRTRTFWDGGLHCITLDIRRQDSMIDLFPERTENLYTY
jgi:hypothetical protein